MTRDQAPGVERRGGKRRRGAAADGDDSTPSDEAYRVVRSNLMVSLAGFKQPRVIISSAHPGEGKTITCANLALSFARAGMRVVLLDLDLRHPDAHRLVGAHNRYGVTDLLRGERTLADCLQYLDLPVQDAQTARGMYFIGTGPQVHNPSELLGVPRTADMLDELGRQADLILVDAPPVLPVADMLVIGRIVTGVILVVESRRTTIPDIAKTKDLLTRNQARILGVVVNKQRPRDSGFSEGYGYGSPPAEARAASNGRTPARDASPDPLSARVGQNIR